MLTHSVILESRRGNTAVWHTALSRYRRNNQSRDFLQDASSFYRGSSIFGFERAHGGGSPKSSSRDWFAPAEPTVGLSGDLQGDRDSAAGSFFGAGAAGPFGNGSQSSIPLQHQFQTQAPRSTKDTVVTKTVDGFEIISTGHYFQNEGLWNKNGSQSKLREF